MKFATLLELGRISNLPTVWSNVLCGAALSGALPRPAPLIVAALSGSLFYVGGMLLNDAFDAGIDARERPERPIPSGRASRREVLGFGFGMLGLGLALLLALALSGVAPSGLALPLAGLATALCVVVYDLWHKGFAHSPIVMGACRAGLYLIGALAVAPALGEDVVPAAVALALYVVGLTHVARFENSSRLGRTWPTFFVLSPFLLAALLPGSFGADPASLLALAVWLGAVVFVLATIRVALAGGPGRIRGVVGALIAGISLVDACFSARRGMLAVAAFAIAAFFFTRRWQRRIAGT